MTVPKVVLFDSPETDLEKDAFGRSKFSEALGMALLKLLSPKSPVLEESFVLALTGPWGSGKTTVMEFALTTLLEKDKSWDKNEQPIVHRFDPWLFNDPTQLLSAFLRGIAHTLSLPDHGKELSKAGQVVKTYEQYLAPVGWLTSLAGIAGIDKAADLLEKASKTLEESAKIAQQDTSGFRKAISEQIKKQPRRILIVIDDIDRLTKQEIRLLMQVLKLTANFSNVVYLLLFDQEYVEAALNEVSVNRGHDYIKKIVQVEYRLPPIDQSLVRRNFFRELNKVLPGLYEDNWSHKRMIRLYDQVLRHFLVTPRDAKRYLNALQFDITVVEDEVDVIDFAAIESLRLFASKAYEFIFSESDFFGVWASEYFDEHDSENSRHFLEGFLDKHYKKGDSLRNAIYNVIWFIFPNIHPQDYDRFEPIDDIEYYRRQRNICHPANFDTYFLLSTPASMISNAETKQFIDAANADQDITEHLSRIIDSDKGHSLSVKVLENIQSVSAAGARQIVGALCSNKSGFAFERGPFRCLRNEFIALTELLVEKSGSNDSERKQVVEKLISSSGSLETWIRFLLYEHNLIEEASKKSSQKDGGRPVKKSASKPLAKEVVDAGIKALTQAIEHLDSEERLHTHPELQPILLYWDDLVSKKRRSEFIEKLLKRPLGAVALLTGFLAKGEIILAEAEDDEYQYRIPGVRLAIYALSKVVPIKCIRKLINAIDQTEIAKLDARQQLAITLLSNSKDDASFSKVVEEPVNYSAPTEPAAVEPVAAGKPS